MRSKGWYYAPINEIRTNNDIPWARKHLNLLRENYRDATYFKDHAPFFEETYNRRWELLVDLNLHIIEYIKEVLGINTRIVDIEELILGQVGRNTRIIKVCQMVGATTYLSGEAAKNYIKAGRCNPFQQNHLMLNTGLAMAPHK